MNIKISQSALALAFFFAVMIKEGLSLQCYVCNSYASPKCNNVAELADYKQTCNETAGEVYCRKIEQDINIDGEDVKRIHRQCATRKSAEEGECLERTGTYRFKSWYCECKNEDFCNSATSTSVSLGLTLAVASSLVFLRKLL